MTYLFIIQGEGRGHMTQAVSLARALEDNGHYVYNAFIGISPQRKVPDFIKEYFGVKVKYFRSPNFIRTIDKKGIHIAFSFLYNFFRVPLYAYEVLRMAFLISKSKADRVINFYDAIGGMAYKLSFCKKPFFVISHQYFFWHPDFIRPENFQFQRIMLDFYSGLCSLGAKKKIALSFTESPDISEKNLVVVSPLLRKEIYNMKVNNAGFCLVYVLNSGFLSEIANWCVANPEKQVLVFTDDNAVNKHSLPNLKLQPLGGGSFIKAMAECESLVCTAGFETVAEAAYMGKKILLIPSRNHYEQVCNATDAERAGIGIRSVFFDPGLIQDGGLQYDQVVLRKWFEKNPGKMVSLVSDDVF